MRNLYRSVLNIVLLLALFSLNTYAAEYVKGSMTPSAVSRERIQFVPMDRVSVSLGIKDGVITGDILQITDETDKNLTTSIGSCALVKVDEDSSICEIVTSSKELGIGNTVFGRKLQYANEKLFAPVYSVLYDISNRYAPNRKITVYVHNVFDSQLNITGYSMRVKGEVENIFSQKARIALKDENILGREFQFYPGDAGENRSMVYEFMAKEKIDSFITAVYSQEGGITKLKFYVYDRYFGDYAYTFQVKYDNTPAEPSVEMKQVLIPYAPVAPPERVGCTISYSERTESVQKYGKAELVSYEAAGNMFKQNDLRTREFNIIAPTDVIITLDNERVKFPPSNHFVKYLEKGKHHLTASFRRGYFSNSKEALVYASSSTVKKEMSLIVNKGGNFYVMVNLDPAFDSENISFHVYKETLKVRSPIKPVEEIRTDKTVETFLD